MTTDLIAAARAMIEPLTGHTPRPWTVGRDLTIGPNGCGVAVIVAANTSQAAPTDARLIAASPDLRDMVATLADALEAERAKVAAAFKAGVKRGISHAAGHTCEDEGCPHYGTRHAHPGDLEAPFDAQAALDKMLAEARREGWRAGQVDMQSQAYDACREWMRNNDSRRVEDIILALRSTEETFHD